MHAVHLPPGHIVGAALLALVLAFAMILLGARLDDLSLSGGGSSTAHITTTTTHVTSTPGTPAWVRNPLAPPSLMRAGG
jgi:hypothetical protein